MNCVVVGYGSIGQRHARILTRLGCKTAVVSRRAVPFPLTYSSLTAALEAEHPDYVVIANRTDQHYGTFQMLAESGFGGTVLVEKPLFHKALELPVHSFKKAYVGYNLRFHPILQKTAELVREERALYAQAYVGQYLPDWRPQRDYRQNYSARKSEGGGVLLDLSHELDYLLWLFGSWKRLAAVGGKYSSLKIDSDDLYSILLSMERCSVVQVHLNYLDRVGRRELTLITDQSTVRADFTGQLLQINGENFSFPLARDETYIKQHQAILAGEEENLCTLSDGLSVLKLIEAVERSAEQKIWVKP